MVYEGAIIRRVVTPKHPGDPRLEDGNAFRTEYVLADPEFEIQGRDAKTDQVTWTTDLRLAFVYPRHLDADLRGKQLSPHCFARVVQRATETDLTTQDGEAASRLAHNQKIVGSNPTPATNLPAEVRPSARGEERRTASGEHDEKDGRIQSTALSSASRAAGKPISRKRKPKPAPDRMAALRAAGARTEPSAGKTWWQEGQYA